MGSPEPCAGENSGLIFLFMLMSYFILLTMCICIFMHICVCVCNTYMGPQKLEEGLRSPDDGIKGGCELPDIDARN